MTLFRSNSTVARIYSLGVAPALRGKGVGRLLMGAAEKGALRRGCTRMRLEVRASNASAISLYERAGFCVIAKKKKYYPDGEDALHMEKRIGP